MKLALFDLDHTILDVDSDYLWADFLIRKGLVDAEVTKQKNIEFDEQYVAGTLDPVAYVEYVAVFLSSQSMSTLNELLEEYVITDLKPNIRPQAVEVIKSHIDQGHEVIVSSATNDFIVNGVCKELGVSSDNVIASKLGMADNKFTGKLVGTPNFQAGKVENLNAWLADKAEVTESWGYSDSYNDKPLLEFATHAYAVTPDDRLRAHAQQVGWEILDWAL